MAYAFLFLLRLIRLLKIQHWFTMMVIIKLTIINDHSSVKKIKNGGVVVNKFGILSWRKKFYYHYIIICMYYYYGLVIVWSLYTQYMEVLDCYPTYVYGNKPSCYCHSSNINSRLLFSSFLSYIIVLTFNINYNFWD